MESVINGFDANGIRSRIGSRYILSAKPPIAFLCGYRIHLVGSIE